MSSEILENNSLNAIMRLLERIANTLDKQTTVLERVEIVLEEKQNKTQEIKEVRELMQNIVKHYKQTEPHYDIQVGSSLQVFRFRNAICKIKNIRNSKTETRKLYKWIRKLEEFEFVERTNDSTFMVLSTGIDWWNIKE